ncbi:GTP cyclohydrolase I [Gracilibacillus halotolerans]|uniref:GTP cyclohydrolase FolE2 n=1 Tax=Gracilibacillus halotolerans TaxID=74386 RepID=A0A841RK28_9BACI|nr:GTP cyclohydrolase FolE2 [Gracilibacillus halotolerans]MBB6511545.1 GTP cyclohydrolase I [Gracilibacillus halotolerans]
MVQIDRKKLPSKEERHKLFGSVEPGERTKPTEKKDMSDLQNVKKDFLFKIDQVGIANVKHPIQIESGLVPKQQTTIGNFEMTSSIKQNHKGTNMSRFTELLHEYSNGHAFPISISKLKLFMKHLTDKLEQNDVKISVTFPWFFERKGPASGLPGMNYANATIEASYDVENGYTFYVTLDGAITTLCPCSKEISEYSAHNQRGNVSIRVLLNQQYDEQASDWKADLLEAAESNASARIHPVLKRPDEKMVTEQAYENPRFVEDIVRLVAADLYEMEYVDQFTVTCQNEESIHLHDAFAKITYDKREDQ